MSGLLFGVLPAGCPLITQPTSAPSETSFLFSLPADKPFLHVVVFLLPGVILPPDTAAAIYMATAAEAESSMSGGHQPKFKFLGGVGPGKESAVFRLGESPHRPPNMVLGISVEPAAEVARRIQDHPPKPTASANTTTQSGNYQVALAQRIIKSAFNFLTSFSGTSGPNQVEVVPLKAFEDWWRKFEGRIRSDPTFLDKDLG